jgi:hypothetical protein
MSISEIEENIIKPLSRQEKEELFRFLAKELGREDELLKYITPGATYPIFTPLGMYRAAEQVQQLLDQGEWE